MGLGVGLGLELGGEAPRPRAVQKTSRVPTAAKL